VSESPRTDGLLTEAIVSRAIAELDEIKRELLDGTGEGAWLRESEARLNNALSDLAVVRDRFRKAQT
jgi:hypothetical protein